MPPQVIESKYLYLCNISEEDDNTKEHLQFSLHHVSLTIGDNYGVKYQALLAKQAVHALLLAQANYLKAQLATSMIEYFSSANNLAILTLRE